MLGAIIGDIAGSVYEQPSRNIKSKEFPFFGALSDYTDDTVLTCAVAEAFMLYKEQPQQVDLHRELIKSLKTFGNAHQFVPYGERFRQWMQNWQDDQPYNSWGNGAPMRVASAGWLFDTLEETLQMAELSAAVTHNHPLAIKGAQAVAAAIFMARNHSSKEQICEYIQKNYYSLDETLDQLRENSLWDVSSEGTVPQAVTAFLESDSFEDAVRNAISLGGDSDTIAAMAGSIAEAYYGIPGELKKQALEILSRASDLLAVYKKFEQFIKMRS